MKGAFVGKKELWRYQDARYNDEKKYVGTAEYTDLKLSNTKWELSRVPLMLFH